MTCIPNPLFLQLIGIEKPISSSTPLDLVPPMDEVARWEEHQAQPVFCRGTDRNGANHHNANSVGSIWRSGGWPLSWCLLLSRMASGHPTIGPRDSGTSFAPGSSWPSRAARGSGGWSQLGGSHPLADNHHLVAGGALHEVVRCQSAWQYDLAAVRTGRGRPRLIQLILNTYAKVKEKAPPSLGNRCRVVHVGVQGVPPDALRRHLRELPYIYGQRSAWTDSEGTASGPREDQTGSRKFPSIRADRFRGRHLGHRGLAQGRRFVRVRGADHTGPKTQRACAGWSCILLVTSTLYDKDHANLGAVRRGCSPRSWWRSSSLRPQSRGREASQSRWDSTTGDLDGNHQADLPAVESDRPGRSRLRRLATRHQVVNRAACCFALDRRCTTSLLRAAPGRCGAVPFRLNRARFCQPRQPPAAPWALPPAFLALARWPGFAQAVSPHRAWSSRSGWHEATAP